MGKRSTDVEKRREVKKRKRDAGFIARINFYLRPGLASIFCEDEPDSLRKHNET